MARLWVLSLLLFGRLFAGCPQDLNGDGSVDFADLFLLLPLWRAAAGQPAYQPACDLDSNGRIDLLDQVILVNHLHRQGCPPQGYDCEIFPGEHVWNTRVDTLAVHDQSAGWLATLTLAGPLLPRFGPDSGFRLTVVSASQAPASIQFSAGGYSDPGPYPIPGDAGLESDGLGGGHRVIVLQRDLCKLFELSQASYANGVWSAELGAVYDLSTYSLRPQGWPSADGAGLPIFPGLLRWEELETGHLNHALRFSAPLTRNQHLWPARHHVSTSAGSTHLPLGLRLRLKSTFDLTPFPPRVQAILRAIQRYGMVLADESATWQLHGVLDSRWDEVELANLQAVTAADFDVVDGEVLRIQEDSGQAHLPPALLYFLALPPAIQAGGSTTLHWNAIRASEISLDPGPDHLSSLGSLVCFPVGETSYELSASDGTATVQTALTVTVVNAVTVSVSPQTAQLIPGETMQFSALVQGSGNAAVLWSVLESGGGTVDPGGTYQAPLIPGSYHLRAVSQADPGAQDQATIVVAPAGMRTVQPIPLDFEEPELVNSLRGWHRWRGAWSLPLDQEPQEFYERFEWSQLEPSFRVYDFSPLLNKRAQAIARGQRFSFRIRCMKDYEDNQLYLPAHYAHLGFWTDIDSDPSTQTFVPDWNHPDLLAAMEALLLALGSQFNQDPTLGWVDIGMFGQWGEWYVKPQCYAAAPPGVVPATEATRKTIVDQHVAAFPDKQLVLFMLRGHIAILSYAFAHPSASIPIGLRCDAFANQSWWQGQWVGRPEWDLVKDRWQTAPVLGELDQTYPGQGADATLAWQIGEAHISTLGNGNLKDVHLFSQAEIDHFLLLGKQMGYRLQIAEIRYPEAALRDGLLPVGADWRNLGVAPRYEPLSCVWILSRSGESWELPGSLDFRALLPTGGGHHSHLDQLLLPAGLVAGSYQLFLQLSDASGRPPLRLANGGRDSEGRYFIGNLELR